MASDSLHLSRIRTGDRKPSAINCTRAVVTHARFTARDVNNFNSKVAHIQPARIILTWWDRGAEFMGKMPTDTLPHIVLNIQTRQPIELDDFVAAFSAISSQYDKFLRSEYPELAGASEMFVRQVRAGSIEADLIPWAREGLGALVNTVEQLDIVLKFVRTYGGMIMTYIQGRREPQATRSDLKDLMGAVTAIATDPNGKATIQVVAFEDGKRKIKAAISFATPEARAAELGIEDHRRTLEKSRSADYERALMTFMQSNVKNAAMGKRTGERVIIEDVSSRDLPLIYASELAEQRIKHEVREADENVYKKGFIVDVNVQYSGDRPVGYRVTNVHQVIDLPDDVE